MLILESVGNKHFWFMIRREGLSGAIIYRETLVPGKGWATRMNRPVWIHGGWTPNLRVALGGRFLSVSQATGGFVVDRTGITRV